MMVSGTTPGHRPILLLGRGFLPPSRSANFFTAASRSGTSRGAQRLGTALVALWNSTKVRRSRPDLRTNSTLTSGPSGRHSPTTGNFSGFQMSDPQPRHAITSRFYNVPRSSRSAGLQPRWTAPEPSRPVPPRVRGQAGLWWYLCENHADNRGDSPAGGR